MQLNLEKREPCWVVLNGAFGKLVSAVKNTVTSKYRKWDSLESVWLVHWKCLLQIIHWAREYDYVVDYSSLPMRWQMVAAGAQVSELAIEDSSANPFSTLFLTEEAPIELIKSAYKILATKHHPDVGGNVKKFREVSDAYQTILKLRQYSG